MWVEWIISASFSFVLAVKRPCLSVSATLFSPPVDSCWNWTQYSSSSCMNYVAYFVAQVFALNRKEVNQTAPNPIPLENLNTRQVPTNSEGRPSPSQTRRPIPTTSYLPDQLFFYPSFFLVVTWNTVVWKSSDKSFSVSHREEGIVPVQRGLKLKACSTFKIGF